VKVIVNGDETLIDDDASVSDVIKLLGLNSGRVAVEINRRILKRSDWNSTQLAEGDKVEIVHFVGGGDF
jgi:thiamine biosynthesis protein ThiS